MNCLVVDDDSFACKAVESCISQTPSLKLIATCNDATSAIKVIQENKIDLIFLDIEMPGTNGFELLEQLKVVPLIILVSAKTQYAIDAFDYDVIDFLSKPFDFNRFTKAVNRAKLNFEKLKEISPAGHEEEFFIKKESKFIRLKFKEIVFVEAMADYVILYIKNGNDGKTQERHTILSTMKAIESKLPTSDFIRIHRSFIVRLDKINSVEDNHVLVNQRELPISRSNKENLLRRLGLS
jgi:DNA-binding LytR/AlgR family response regulator